MAKAIYKKILEESIIEGVLYGDKETYKIRPIEKTGSGRYSKYTVDQSSRYIAYFEELGITKNMFKFGNDAINGGMLGDYIIVKFDKRNALIKSIIQNALIIGKNKKGENKFILKFRKDYYIGEKYHFEETTREKYESLKNLYSKESEVK